MAPDWHVWMAPDWQGFFPRFGVCDHLQSCVRPLIAACVDGPRLACVDGPRLARVFSAFWRVRSLAVMCPAFDRGMCGWPPTGMCGWPPTGKGFFRVLACAITCSHVSGL